MASVKIKKTIVNSRSYKELHIHIDGEDDLHFDFKLDENGENMFIRFNDEEKHNSSWSVALDPYNSSNLLVGDVNSINPSWFIDTSFTKTVNTVDDFYIYAQNEDSYFKFDISADKKGKGVGSVHVKPVGVETVVACIPEPATSLFLGFSIFVALFNRVRR